MPSLLNAHSPSTLLVSCTLNLPSLVTASSFCSLVAFCLDRFAAAFLAAALSFCRRARSFCRCARTLSRAFLRSSNSLRCCARATSAALVDDWVRVLLRFLACCGRQPGGCSIAPLGRRRVARVLGFVG